MSKAVGKGPVILVEDEKIIRLSYRRSLEQSGYEARDFDAAKKALPHISRDWPGVLVSDIMMPGMDGLEFLRQVREIDPDLPMILITGHGDVPMAVQAMRDGAYDFIQKPFAAETFFDVLRRAMEKRRLVMEVRRLRSAIEAQDEAAPRILGKTPVIERLRKIIDNVAGADADVLLVGETGTGKDLVAKILHGKSPRRKNHFVAINCGAIPESIMESELFGHEAGAFTGANRRRIGKFEYADGGTLFLDEIESMPLHLQVKLLRALQERVIERIGSNEAVAVNIRVIAATKVNLRETERFRQDLFYRLNVVQIMLPPLRDRLEDVPFLFQHFVAQSAQRFGMAASPSVSRELMTRLLARKWEGNVRELKNEAEKFVLGLMDDAPEAKAEKSGEPDSGLQSGAGLCGQMRAFEKSLIEQELRRQGGSIKKTHAALGIPRQTLCSKMSRYGLLRKDYID